MSLIIIAPFPDNENIKDGMLMRVKAIDNLLHNQKRRYLNISLTHNSRVKSIMHTDYTEELFLHPIWDIKKIIQILKNALNIYAHSINAFRLIPYALPLLHKSKNNLILDAHGVVPEEFQMYEKNVKAVYLNFIEKLIFKKISHCISVSETMSDHFIQKYSRLQNKWTNHIYYIYNSVMHTEAAESDNKLKTEFGITDSDCVLIYSGNLQKWQNIDLMLQTVSDICNSRLKVIILTGNQEGFKQMIAKYRLEDKVYVYSVAPSELGKYYSISNYGFLLRDDILVNNVANPTKMLEYLSFGIIPIVISPNIGDYNRLGYDYIALDQLKKQELKPIKSKKNVTTASNIMLMNKKFDINSIFLM